MNSHSQQMNELFGALSKAQASILSAKKDSKNPFFKSNFADLSSVWDAIRKPLTDNGLCIIQTCEGEPGAMFLETWLGHCSGQWMKSRVPLNPAKSDPQSMGSFITYMKRYSLSAIVGVVSDDDDDGEAAMRGVRNSPPVKLVVEKPVTEEMVEELKRLLQKDKDFKDTVETFVLTNLGKQSFLEVSPKDFEKIMKRTREHMEKINDTATTKKS